MAKKNKRIRVIKLTFDGKILVLLIALIATTCVFRTNNNKAIKTRAEIFNLKDYGMFTVKVIDEKPTFIYESIDNVLGVSEIDALENLNKLGYSIYFIKDYRALKPIKFKYKIVYDTKKTSTTEEIPIQ